MADKTIGELEPVKIGGLPHAPDIYSDIKIPGELQGDAVYITGEQINNYAKAAAKEEADAAAKSAEAAKSDADRAAEKASEAADVALYPPKVQGGHWWTWDSTKNAYTDSGVDATVSLSVAETVTGEPGEPAKVENIGTETDAKLKFTIPQGQKGDPGEVTRADLDAALAKKQDALTGTQGQVVGFDGDGKAVAAHVGGTNLALDTEREQSSMTQINAVMGQHWVLSDRGKRVLNTVGQVFTFSLEAKADVDNQEVGLNLRLDNAAYQNSEIMHVKLTTEYKKYSVTSVVKNGGSTRAWLVNSRAQGGVVGNVHTRNVKVELGTVATDWSPAPEDLVYKWQTEGVLPHRYVVRWDKAQNTCTRLYDAAGITTDTTHFAYHGAVDPAYDNPFDKLYPWSHRKLCKADKAKYKELYEAGEDVMGAITKWEGGPGFALGGDGMDMVYTPEFWMRQWEDGGYVYIGVADGPIYGWQYVPEMVLGRYLASDDGNEGLTSLAGDVPYVDTVSLAQLHTKAKADHLTLDTIQTWDAETVLMVVEYANMNCQSAIGRGVDSLHQAESKHPMENATNSTTVKVSTADAAIIIPGAIFAAGAANDRGTVARAAVVSKSDADGVTTVTLDREITITTAQFWNIHGLYNAPDEAIGSKSGYIGTDGKCHAYYRGRNCWGSCCRYLLGAYQADGTGRIWAAPDVETADELDELDKSKCIDTGCALPQISSKVDGYIKELHLLPDYPMAPFCKTIGGDSTKPVGDCVWCADLNAGNTICFAGENAFSGLRVGRFTADWRSKSSIARWNAAASLAFKRPKNT